MRACSGCPPSSEEVFDSFNQRGYIIKGDEARVQLHTLRVLIASTNVLCAGRGYLVYGWNHHAMTNAKRNSLILLIATGMFTLLLAMSLPNLVLLPGQSFSLGPPQANTPGVSSVLPGGDLLILIFRGLLALSVIMLPFYIVYSLLTSEGRQRLIVDVVLIVALLLIGDYLHNHRLPESAQQETPVSAAPPDLTQGSAQPTARFPATPPSWLPPAVILAASAITVGLILAIIAFFSRRARMPASTLERLGTEAQNAIESLQTGGDFRATIIQCYQQMSRVVREERGITRDLAMTPREFEDRLTAKGLPHASIRTLTRLFEQVRYGGAQTDTPEQNLALSCLADIVSACKATGSQYEG
jgi:hypothetical protein